MSKQLKVSTGQYSDKGRKAQNQDAHGVLVPREPLLQVKGICVALADGISSSQVSQAASQAAVATFLEDYYCTSEAWSVKTSAERVIAATNSWLHAQTQSSQFRYEKDSGYVCTFSALVLKSRTAHIFHAGDARIYRLREGELEQLTEDHRLWISEEKSYLSRALGVAARVELDYRALPIECGDMFVLATDGVYEHVNEAEIVAALAQHDAELDHAAALIGNTAYDAGSGDNLTIQIVRVDALPDQSSTEILQGLSKLPFAPALAPRMNFDGYTIVRELHASHRSQVYLALDDESLQPAVLKVPGAEVREDTLLLERFLVEEWVARRIDNPHVLKLRERTRARNFVYFATELVDGQTLSQWMLDHPAPSLELVRGIIEQIAVGLQAFHRLEILHQDLRPANVMIDGSGTVKLIDFGSVRVAGIAELDASGQPLPMLGTEQYMAPEYLLGEVGSTQSDIYSLGVIAYQMLSGRLPYGAEAARARSRQLQARLSYTSVLHEAREIPAWVDDTLRRAVHPNPAKRYAELSEFIWDLRHPSQSFLNKTRAPLIERNPVAFWKGVAAILAVIVVVLLKRLLK